MFLDIVTQVRRVSKPLEVVREVASIKEKSSQDMGNGVLAIRIPK